MSKSVLLPQIFVFIFSLYAHGQSYDVSFSGKESLRQGNFFISKANHDSAIYHFEKAAHEFEETNEWDQFQEAILQRSNSLIIVGEYSKLEQESLEILKKKSNGTAYRLKKALAYRNIGILQIADSIWSDPIKNYRTAISIWTDVFGFDHRSVALGHVHLAGSFLGKARYDSALKYYGEALKFYKNDRTDNNKIDRNKYVTLCYNGLGWIYKKRGSYSIALDYFQRALAERLKEVGTKDRYVRYYYSNIGLLYMQKKDVLALKYLEKSISIESEFLGEKDRSLAMAYNNLGSAYYYFGKYQHALKAVQKSRSLMVENNISDKVLHAKVNTSLGIAFKGLRSFDSSNFYLVKGLELWRKISNSGSTDLIFCLNELANLYYIQGDFSNSIRIYEESVRTNIVTYRDNVDHKVKSRTKTLENEYFLTSLLGLAENLLAVGDKQSLNSALLNLQLADSVADNSRHIQLAQVDKVALGKIRSAIYEKGIEVCFGLYSLTKSSYYIDTAFYFSTKSKSIVLVEALIDNSAKVVSAIPDSLLMLESKLKSQQSYYRSKMLLSNSNEEPMRRNKLLNLKLTLDSLNMFFESNYPDYFSKKYIDFSLSIDEVRSALRHEEILIEYFVGDSSTFIFTFTKESVELVKLEHKRNLIMLFQSTRDDLKNSILEDFEFKKKLNQQLYELYEMFLSSALGSFSAEKNKLIIIPHGQLSYIPFGILLTADPRNSKNSNDLPYLLRKYSIQYGYSAALQLKKHTKNITPPEQGFIAFAPTYEDIQEDSLAQTKLGRFRDEIQSLKFNQPEVQKVNAYMGGETRVGRMASEHSFKQAVKDHRILHLAMHAFVDNEEPMNSRLIFTQSKHTVEDNFLHAHEIYNLDINAEMTVLSACETGFGKLAQGEGVMSLARAFTYAGCPSVVMSHWPVNDAATAKLMELFYKYLADGLEKDKALQQAKLEFLETADPAQANPYFWGSFVVMGDVSPIQINQPMNWRYVLAACLFFSILILALMKVINQRHRIPCTCFL